MIEPTKDIHTMTACHPISRHYVQLALPTKKDNHLGKTNGIHLGHHHLYHSFRKLTLAIIAPDSTIVYYHIQPGLIPPTSSNINNNDDD